MLGFIVGCLALWFFQRHALYSSPSLMGDQPCRLYPLSGGWPPRLSTTG